MEIHSKRIQKLIFWIFNPPYYYSISSSNSHGWLVLDVNVLGLVYKKILFSEIYFEFNIRKMLNILFINLNIKCN